MADASVPIRPQRSIGRSNASRETTGGLLMSVIRSLTTSRDSADRDRERAELEKGFAVCDQRLGELIGENQRHLYKVMTTFTQVLDNLATAKESLLDIREKLCSSQKLLHCKRDELKKLWLELVENRAVLAMLEQIEVVAELPRQVDEFAGKKHFLHAAQCCVDGLRQLGELSPAEAGNNQAANSSRPLRFSAKGYGSLSKIEALSEVRNELLTKKEWLFDAAIDELHRHLYMISSSELRQHYLQALRAREQSHEQQHNSAFYLNVYNESRSRKVSTVNELAAARSGASCENYPEEDSKQYISMLTKCLGLLNRIGDAAEVIRERCETEFIHIVIKTVQEVHHNLNTAPKEASGGHQAKQQQQQQQPAPAPSTSFHAKGLEDLFENSLVLTSSLSAGHDLQLSALLNQSASKVRTLTQQNLVVLSCSTLIGHIYDAYSHIPLGLDAHTTKTTTTTSTHVPSITIGHSGQHHHHQQQQQHQPATQPISKLKIPKASQMLREFFQMLLYQYRLVVALHGNVVLPNLKRLEAGLNVSSTVNTLSVGGKAAGDEHGSQLYSSSELWFKVQMLVQQLLDFYLDASNEASAANANAIGSNATGHLSNLLHGNLPNIFNSGPLFSMNKGNARGDAGGVIKDYSAFFPKRRQLVVGAMNAMNAMTKTTMNAMSSNPSGAANVSNGGGGPSENSADHGGGGFEKSDEASLVDSNSNEQHQHQHQQQQQQQHQQSTQQNWQQQQQNVTSVGVFRSQVRQLFKFERTAQAQSWNAFLNEQHQKQLLDSAEKKDDDDQHHGGHSQGHHHSEKSNRRRPPTIKRLFDSLKSIAPPSIDNLVIIYALLFRFGLEEPGEADLHLPPVTGATSGGQMSLNNIFLNNAALLKKRPKETDRLKHNVLYAYLISATEKFSLNIHEQLERMLESAKDSLNRGVTVLLPNPIEEKLAQDTIVAGGHKSTSHHIDGDGGGALKAFKEGLADCQSIFNTPLLESVVLIDVSLHELFALIQVMPDYSSEFLNYMCHVLTSFKEAAIETYTNIVTSNHYHAQSQQQQQQSQQLGAFNNNSTYDLRSASGGEAAAATTVPVNASSQYERKRIISANWARDEDICRLLKSLPNWLSLEENRKALLDPLNSKRLLEQQNESGHGFKFDTRAISFEESPEEIRLRNIRETEILAKNLSNKIPKTELLWQEGQLRAIAQMQESFEWLACRCDDLINSIIVAQQQVHTEDDEEAQFFRDSEVCLATIAQLMKDFTELSETCLLTLHLEVRVHCFYHLRELNYTFFNSSAPQLDAQMMAEARSIGPGGELYCDDLKILPLINDLRMMYDELTSAALKTCKMTYVFEGLGHLISTIFMNSVARVKRIKPVGIKRTCRAIFDIQRRLTAITKNRELALDYAREYFELLLMTPDELIASIIERGPQFLHSEYATAMTLLYQSELANSPAVNVLLGKVSPDEVTHMNNSEMAKHLKRLEDILSEMPVMI